jgi:RNA methyltransferase, TrmH family
VTDVERLLADAGTDTGVVRLLAAARDDARLVLLEGFHALKHARRFGGDVVAAATADPERLVQLAAELAPDLDLEAVVTVPPAALGPRPHPTRVLAVARRPPFDPAALGPGRVVLLERPRHLGNVGAVVRVAAAAGAAGVLTTGDRDPWDPAALRGSAGLHFALPVGRVNRPPADRPLVALDPAGEPLGPLPDDAVLAFGSERHGLGDELLARADRRVAIPMRAGVSSLNLATAVAVALYAAR